MLLIYEYLVPINCMELPMKKVFLEYACGFASLTMVCLAVLFFTGNQEFKTYAVVMLIFTTMFAIATALCCEMENVILRQQQESVKNSQPDRHPECGCSHSA